MTIYLQTVPAVIFLAFAVAVIAQTGDFAEVPILRAAPADRGCFHKAGVFDAAPAVDDEKCTAAARTLNVDYSRERLIAWSAAGDCHMRVRLKALRSDAGKKILIVLNNIYGGCRAGGRRAGWIVVEKPPEGYLISIREVGVDRTYSGTKEDDDFVFPKPAPSITTEEIPHTRIDPADCLPLTGQSQWVISKPEFLEEAIKGREDVSRCREHFRSLELGSKTLVGVSFASGYCGKPDGMTIKVFRETSSDRSRDRVVLRVRYDDPGANTCKKWATYPAWVLIPSIAAGYRFDVDTGTHDATQK